MRTFYRAVALGAAVLAGGCAPFTATFVAAVGQGVENRGEAMHQTVVPLHRYDVDTLARTLYGEARGEPINGMIAVAWVIVNRAKRGAPRFPATISGVCKQRHQFTCWSPTDPNARLCALVTESDPSFALTLFVAAGVLAGQFADPVNGADHYYAASMRQPPAWAAAMAPRGRIGGHLFFKEH